MAPIKVKCWGCGKSIKVKPEFAGKKGKCPVCSKVINIPDPSEPGDSYDVNEDISASAIKEVARSIAEGPGGRPEKKKGLLARIFGKK